MKTIRHAQLAIRLAGEIDKPRIPLSKEEFFELALRLYDRVRGLPHYQVAMVGWEVGARTHLEELKAEWADEISDGSVHGLVVAKKLLPEFPPS